VTVERRVTSFATLERAAKVWLKGAAADPGRSLLPLLTKAEKLSVAVPAARMDDWRKLLDGFALREGKPTRSPEQVRARVEGLVRACKAFRESEPPPPPKPRPVITVGPDHQLQVLPGLGPKTARALAEEGITTVSDLFWALPARYDDWSQPLSVGAFVESLVSEAGELAPGAPTGRVCLRAVVVSATLVPMRAMRSVRVVLADADAADSAAEPSASARKRTVVAQWFYAAHGVLALARPGTLVRLLGRALPPGEKGKPGAKVVRFIHPEIVREEDSVPTRARYARAGVTDAAMRKAIAATFAALQDVGDPVPAAIAAREGMLPARSLLLAVHGDEGALAAPPDEEIRRAVRERLAWAETFASVRDRLQAGAGGAGGAARALPKQRAALTRLKTELGFPFTGEQLQAIKEIEADLTRTQPMRRLLFGDVGTGKTAVAMAAIAQCTAAGAQAAVLAPTGVLAEQYLEALAPLARATGSPIALLTGDTPAPQRARLLRGVAEGSLKILVGTHALLGEGVAFAGLALVVVDEQHRLGVAQRLALVRKGKVVPHLLTLSATPIPRTLSLALRGELATSRLLERPRGRPDVQTIVRTSAELGQTLADMRAAIARGERCFFVTPRIGRTGRAGGRGDEEEPEEDEDELDLPSAVDRFRDLDEVLAQPPGKPGRVRLLHGRLPPAEKSGAMRDFRSGAVDVLVATTVIEVGVDVPEATMMIVEGAERFGLAQLHQLRGRVGRGDRPSVCILHASKPLDARSRARLDAMTLHSRGIDLAQVDLALRGAGDLGGTRQSGAEETLLWLDPETPPAWLERLAADAEQILQRDPRLAASEHEGLRRRIVAMERRKSPQIEGARGARGDAG
jgi:ATP-dependent DNA helicase RecG